METKLIMIEGIPGSGKSSFARRAAAHYAKRGRQTRLYNEGDAHPADLAWNACIPLAEREQTLAPYAVLRPEIDRQTRIEDGYAIIAYTQVQTQDKSFFAAMEGYEVYDRRVPYETFAGLHRKRWQAFGKRAEIEDELTIFECALLQNHVTELLLWHLLDEAAIQKHVRALVDAVASLSPVLVYLSPPDVRQTVVRVAKERVFAGGSWMEGMIEYTERTPYGKAHRLQGLDGVVQCLEARKRIELGIIQALPIYSIVLDNIDNDWEALWTRLEQKLPG